MKNEKINKQNEALNANKNINSLYFKYPNSSS